MNWEPFYNVEIIKNITFQIFQVIENPAELEKLEVFQVKATQPTITATTILTVLTTTIITINKQTLILTMLQALLISKRTLFLNSVRNESINSVNYRERVTQ